jgi:MFS family permease
MIVSITGSASLAGLSVGLFGLSRFLVSYPVGKVTDAYGRKPGIQLGLVIALVGALVVAWSMSLRSIVVLTLGLLIFGMGMAAAHQLRVAVTDMFPPARRAEALGYLALGSIVGLGISPVLVGTAERAAPNLGLDPLALPWLMLPVLIVAGMVLVTFVRPDPKEIGQNLAHYFPGTSPLRVMAQAQSDFSVMSMLRRPPIRLAIVANAAAQGNMAIVMVLTSLVLHHHGHSLRPSRCRTCSIPWHVRFTIPLGRFADRLGREVMYPGSRLRWGRGAGHLTPAFGRSRSNVPVGIGGGQCRFDRLDRGPGGNSRTRSRHRRQRQRCRCYLRRRCIGDRPAGAVERPARSRHCCRRVRGGAARDGGRASAPPIRRLRKPLTATRDSRRARTS